MKKLHSFAYQFRTYPAYAFIAMFLDRLEAEGYIKVHVHGGSLPADGPAIIVSNHISYLDAFIVPVAVRSRSWPVTEWFQRLKKYPPIIIAARIPEIQNAWPGYLFDPTLIYTPIDGDRVSGVEFLRNIKITMTEGHTLYMCPEGGITKSAEALLAGKYNYSPSGKYMMRPWSPGLGHIMSRQYGSKYPKVTPVHISNADNVYRPGGSGLDFSNGPIVIRIGETIQCGSGSDEASAQKKVQDAIFNLADMNLAA